MTHLCAARPAAGRPDAARPPATPSAASRFWPCARRSALAALALALLAGAGPAFAQSGTPAPAPTPVPAPPSPASPALPAAPSGAPGAVKSQHGAWAIVCDQPAGATGEQCALLQNVVAEDRQEVGLSVVALKTADKQARILRILAPLGILLPNGLGLYVDGKDIGRAQFVRCFSDGCYAEVILQDTLLKTLSDGKSATFIVFQTPEQGIGIPVDLNGFGEGFQALP